MPNPRHPRNEREAHAELVRAVDRFAANASATPAMLPLRSRLDARHASAHAAASIARHRAFKARLVRFAAVSLWLALMAVLGAALAIHLAGG